MKSELKLWITIIIPKKTKTIKTICLFQNYWRSRTKKL